MSDYEVRTDRSANRLYLRLEGHMDEAQTKAAADEVIDAMADLEPGWEMVNDISEFKPATQDATAHIERGKKAAAENGVGAIVRVVDNVTGKLQFNRVGKDVQSYEVTEAESLEEAERLLDER
jgi:hypothetical protein